MSSQAHDQRLELRWAREGARGMGSLSAIMPGVRPITDRLRLADAASRDQFCSRVCAIWKGVDREEVAFKLDELAASDTSPLPHRSQADALLELVQNTPGLDLFHTAENEAYVTLPVDDHRETWSVKSEQFRQWLAGQIFRLESKVPKSSALPDALTTITGIAKFNAPERRVALRIAEHHDEIWLDLCDAEWRAVRIGKGDWSVVDSQSVPVRFVRTSQMQALPVPTRGGSLRELRPLLNITDESQWVIVVGWLLGVFIPGGPYPILAVTGEQGSAKSTLCILARRLVDPNVADLRRPPRDERDVFVSSGNNLVCSYNNISDLAPHIADALCALATDRGFATRALFKDGEEFVCADRRPIILNGIDDLTSRPDLMDRSLPITLEVVTPERRQDETLLMAEFERIRPSVMGSLLDAVATAMRYRSSVVLYRKPRLADLATWVTAAEPALGWATGTFLATLEESRQQSHAMAIEASPIGPAILDLAVHGPWQGTASELLTILGKRPGPTRPSTDWPGSPKSLANLLRRLAPSLREAGVAVRFSTRPQGHAKRRIITIDPSPSAVSGGPSIASGDDSQEAATGASMVPTDVTERPGTTPYGVADRADHADRVFQAPQHLGAPPPPEPALPPPDARPQVNPGIAPEGV